MAVHVCVRVCVCLGACVRAYTNTYAYTEWETLMEPLNVVCVCKVCAYSYAGGWSCSKKAKSGGAASRVCEGVRAHQGCCCWRSKRGYVKFGALNAGGGTECVCNVCIVSACVLCVCACVRV